jgi:hypothetical protein
MSRLPHGGRVHDRLDHRSFDAASALAVLGIQKSVRNRTLRAQAGADLKKLSPSDGVLKMN